MKGTHMATQQKVKKLALYYKNVVPGHRYLKEEFGRLTKDQILQAIKEKRTTSELGLDLDSSFLFESQRFLKLGLVNFVCFKFLLGGGYGSWAGVTRYFSAFYAANSLLRLAGKAIVNMD